MKLQSQLTSSNDVQDSFDAMEDILGSLLDLKGRSLSS